jgi:hypothetical protein
MQKQAPLRSLQPAPSLPLRSQNGSWRGAMIRRDCRFHLRRDWRRGDVVALDNLKPHKAAEVCVLIEQRGATLRYQPPHSHTAHGYGAGTGETNARGPRGCTTIHSRHPLRPAGREPRPGTRQAQGRLQSEPHPTQDRPGEDSLPHHPRPHCATRTPTSSRI